MGYVIQAGETDGTKLRVPLTIINTDGTEHAASLSGVKARLSINGGTAANSTNDVVRVDAGTCYVQLTTGEAATFTAGDRVTVKVPASGTRMVALALVEVAADNLYAAAPTAASVATAVWGAASRTLTSGAAPTAAENAAAVESALADNFVAIPGAVVTAMRTETTLSAWGVASQPAGGSTLTYVERRNGTVIGTRTAYFSAANICVGMTAVA